MRKVILYISSLTGIIIFLILVQVIVSTMLSTSGIELSEMQKTIVKLKKENTILSEKLLQLSSLTEVEKKSEKLGFVDGQSDVYLSTPLPIAVKR